MPRTRRPSAPNRWGRLGMRTLFAILGLAIIATSINYNALMAELHLGGATDFPAVPSVDHATMDKAAASAAGQKLKTEGYTPTSVISDTHITDWLDGEQQAVTKTADPGPYVIFSKGATQFDTNTPPEAIEDATNQVIVGLYEAYTTGGWKGRGTTCYTSGDPRELAAVWTYVNVALQGKSLDQPVTLNHDDVPQLPADMSTLACYVFVS
jgi:hypothetical protein